MVLFEQAVQQWAYMTQDVGAFLDVHACESLALRESHLECTPVAVGARP